MFWNWLEIEFLKLISPSFRRQMDFLKAQEVRLSEGKFNEAEAAGSQYIKDHDTF